MILKKGGITKAVVVGRDTPSLTVSNDVIYVIKNHKELIGIASVDPQTHGLKVTLDEIERSTKQLGLKGINVEPGFGNPAVHADDRDFLGVYDACQELGFIYHL